MTEGRQARRKSIDPRGGGRGSAGVSGGQRARPRHAGRDGAGRIDPNLQEGKTFHFGKKKSKEPSGDRVGRGSQEPPDLQGAEPETDDAIDRFHCAVLLLEWFYCEVFLLLLELGKFIHRN